MALQEGMELLNNTFSTNVTQGVPLDTGMELQTTVLWNERTATISVRLVYACTFIKFQGMVVYTMPPYDSVYCTSGANINSVH